jgi:hypothetical protein
MHLPCVNDVLRHYSESGLITYVVKIGSITVIVHSEYSFRIVVKGANTCQNILYTVIE